MGCRPGLSQYSRSGMMLQALHRALSDFCWQRLLCSHRCTCIVDVLSQERRMRAYSAALAAALIVGSLTKLVGAQASRLEGAWKSLGGHVVAPDTSYDIPAFTGMAVIHGAYISQAWVTQSPNGVRQAGELKDADTKAARYDAVIANAGTIELRGKTDVMHVVQARDPEGAGQ